MICHLILSGFTNVLFPFYAKVASKNHELYTAIHSLFSFVAGSAILSVGPIGAEILRHSPPIDMNSYALGRYRVCSLEGLVSCFRAYMVVVSCVVYWRPMLCKWLSNTWSYVLSLVEAAYRHESWYMIETHSSRKS